MNGINLFDYTDYRKFLKKFYSEKKRENKTFSYESFARKAKMNKVLLFNIIKGKRSLVKENILNIGKAMQLGKKELEFFEALVQFNESRSSQQKDFFWKRIRPFRKNSKLLQIKENQFQYFSNWYNMVIWELLSFKKTPNDPASIAKKLHPSATTQQVEKSIKLLETLGLIKKDKNGDFKPSGESLTTGDQVTSAAIRKLRLELIEMAYKATERVPVDLRDVSSVTLRTSQKGFEKLRDRISEFRKELMVLADDENDPDRVYQVNFQLFPVTKLNKHRSKA